MSNCVSNEECCVGIQTPGERWVLLSQVLILTYMQSRQRSENVLYDSWKMNYFVNVRWIEHRWDLQG